MSDSSLPDGWKVVALGDLLTESSDLTYGVVQPGAPTPQGIPIIRVKDIRDGRVDTDDPLLISPEIERQYERSRIRGGELLVTLVGTVGETAVATDDLRGWNTARAVATVRLPTADDSRWVGFCLQSPDGKDRIGSRVNTTVQTTLNLKDLREFPVALPPKTERQAIAGVLGALDDKIESNRRLSRLAQEYARTELEYACSDARRVVQVGELVRSVQDRKKSVDPDVRYVGLEHFTGFDLSLWKSGRAADTKSASKTCSQGDLLFGRIRPYFGNVCLAPGDAVVAQSVEVLRANQVEDREAAFLRLSSREFIDKATLLSSGTTMPQVKWHDLQKEVIVMPSDTRSVEFHKRVAPYFEVIARTPREVTTLAALRDLLLPELLSGRLRVNDAEKVVEGAV